MNGTHTVYDAIVVGSGAAGSWAVKDLTEGGLKVLLLEAGRKVDIASDFPTGVSTTAMGTVQRVKAAILGQYVQARCGLFSEGTKHFYVSDRENPYTTLRKSPFLWVRGRQLGGRLHTWGRHVPRMSKYEFKSASLRGEGIDWPLSYGDLAPHYDRVERTLGVYGTNAGIPNCPDGQYVGPGVTTKIERSFLANVESRLPNIRVMHARNIRHDNGRIPLPIRIALATARLDIRTDAIASRLLIDPSSGKSTGVEYVDRSTRATHAAYGKVIVLCASPIESVRILLNSKCARHPSGVGGSTGHLGHYVCDHVTYGQTGKVPDKDVEPAANEDSFDFGGTGLYIPSFCEEEQRNFSGGYGIQISIGRGSPAWAMFAFGEMQPRYENRVSIDASVKDAWGIPAARIECSHSESDVNMVAHMRRMLPEIARAGGLEVDDNYDFGRGSIAFRLLRSQVFTKYGALWPGGAIHETGGARMGDKAENSVLNSYCQCWHADNVFVTDGACFVSHGFQNHTLTVMALTSRACQYIVHDYGKQVG
jgi:choline dehydrogenase-like flavoprotein